MPVQKDKQKRDEMRAAVVTKAQAAADATAASEDGEAEVSRKPSHRKDVAALCWVLLRAQLSRRLQSALDSVWGEYSEAPMV